MKITLGKNLEITIDRLEEQMHNVVVQYRKAATELYNKGRYIRGRSYFPRDGGKPGNVDIYVLDENGQVQTLCYNVTRCRGIRLY